MKRVEIDDADGLGGIGIASFAAAFDASPTPMVLCDPRRDDMPIVWMNEAFLSLTGYERDEIHGRNCRMLQGPASDPAAIRAIHDAVTAGRSVECELFNYRKDGSVFLNGMTINPVRDASGEVVLYFSAQADMTDKHRLQAALRDANDDLERQVGERTAALQSALEQKTALLHEVDHRVKNNLQVITSLMLLKARRTPAGEAHDALQAMAERIGALSTAHRMLYSAGDATRFDLREFADEVLADLNAGLDPARTRIEAEIEAVGLTAAMAAPLALMLHELATNAVRPACPGEREGRVAITARRSGAGMRLVIQDDGVGIEAAVPNPAGFGRTLVEMVVRQLRGRIDWVNTAPGTRVDITIPVGSPANAR